MSVCITTDIFCDADGCGDWVSGVTSSRTDAKGARKEAKRFGWRCTPVGDFCPAHKDNPRKESSNHEPDNFPTQPNG